MVIRSLTLSPSLLFRHVPTQSPVLVAVSGGSDSIALLLLANVWALKNNVTLQAITVDHGLRAEAAAEAAFVAGVCAGLNIPHITLAWEGIKPSFGIQEAARQSRYSLMDDFAHEIGAEVILTGHTLDDQMETVMMRAMRQSDSGDGRGLAGMGKVTALYGGVRIIRPLLSVTRVELRGFLMEMAQPWIEDPSNLDESYERVRIRRSLEKFPERKEQLMRLAAASAGLRRFLARNVADQLRDRVTLKPGPVYHYEVGAIGNDDSGFDAVAAQAIQTLIAVSGGQNFLVPRHRLGKLFDAVKMMMLGGQGTRLTLGGAIIEIRKDHLIFYREARNQSSLLLEAGEAAIWDGRMHVHNDTAMPVFVEVATRQHVAEYEALRGKPYAVKPRAALRSTPVLHVQTVSGSTTPHLPLVEFSKLPRGLEIRIASPAIEHFCPDFDEPVGDWVRSLDQYPAASLQP